MGGRLQPALLGGLFIGVLSGLPFINFANACCCLWVVTGGVLAVYLLQQNQPEPLTAADGALIGLMAGMVGAVVETIISIPVTIYFGPIMAEWVRGMVEGRDIPAGLLEALDQPVSAVTILGNLIFRLVAYVIFGMLGGVLGVAIFRRKDARLKTED